MTHIKLDVDTRTAKGNDCRKLRRDGILPAIVFGKRQEEILIQLSIREFLKAYKESGRTNVIDLMAGAKKIPAIVNEIDIDPVHNTPRHVNFLAVDLKQKIHASVPLNFVGEARGIKENGGVVIESMNEVEVEALPDNIPAGFDVDVEGLVEIGDTLHVSDLVSDGKFDLITDPTLVVASLSAQSTEEDFETGDELPEGMEGDEATEEGEEKASSEEAVKPEEEKK